MFGRFSRRRLGKLLTRCFGGAGSVRHHPLLDIWLRLIRFVVPSLVTVERECNLRVSHVDGDYLELIGRSRRLRRMKAHLRCANCASENDGTQKLAAHGCGRVFLAKQITLIKAPWLTGPVNRFSNYLSTGVNRRGLASLNVIASEAKIPWGVDSSRV
jgi:hypothetical protein